MIQSVGIPLLQGWLFISGICFLYLILLSKLKLGYRQNQLLFAGLGTLMFQLYMITVKPGPEMYALIIVPTCLLCVMFLEGWTISLYTYVVIAASGFALLGYDPWPPIAGGALLTALGLFYARRLLWDATWRIYVFALSGVVVYIAASFITSGVAGTSDLLRLPIPELGIILLTSLLSSQYVPFVYQFVKLQVKLQRELILSEKYQSVGQMAASISHEIRNPLTTARGFLQLMDIDKLSKENFERYRKYAFEGLDHANNVITEYLNYTKPSVEAAKLLDVKGEIESVVQWLQPYSVQQNVTIVTHHMSEEKPYVYAQPKHFQQCMLNIMKNAIEAMVDGGLLTVQTQIEQGQVQILIRDTGTGMSREQLKRIGKPYFSTKETGTGLGLMVVMSLVKAMKGKIIFRSKLNQGTICEIHLQRYPQSIENSH
ncbi:ATP-binding protein [Paenibacillus sp. PL2-23]|uniref:ATP-binding protein n=1 Tax=Paenibacillus sp. PL2-23 TaxID=2100729 RepID=UPI0030F7C9BB